MFFRYIYLPVQTLMALTPQSCTSTCADGSCGRTTFERAALERLIVNEKEENVSTGGEHRTDWKGL